MHSLVMLCRELRILNFFIPKSDLHLFVLVISTQLKPPILNSKEKEKYFERIRRSVDKLELYVDDEDWPLVKYRELLFLR